MNTRLLIVLPMFLLASVCVSGCATSALLHTGKRLEETSRITEARLTKDAVIIGYSVNITNEGISTSADRWVTVPLSRLEKIIKWHEAGRPVTNQGVDVERLLDDYGVDLERMKVKNGSIPEPLRRCTSPLSLISVSSVDEVERHLPVREFVVAVQAKCPGKVWIMVPVNGHGGDVVNCDLEYRYARPRSAYFIIVPLMPFAACFDALVVFPYLLITQPSFK